MVVDPGKGNNIFAAEVQQRVNRLIELVREENTRAEAAGEHIPFAEPINTNVNRSGDLETIEIPLNSDTGDEEALDAVGLLRETFLSSDRSWLDRRRAFEIFKNLCGDHYPLPRES